MFFTEEIKAQWLRKLSLIQTDIDDLQKNTSTKFKELDEESENSAESYIELLHELEQLQTQISEIITNEAAQAKLVNEIKSIVDNHSDTIKTLNEHYEKTTKLSLKYFEHATRFDQGVPRAEIVSSYLDEDGKLNTELNWNKDFIQHLINCGFVGQDDKEIIQQWINNLLYQFREEGDISE